jgi:hypothetical protein
MKAIKKTLFGLLVLIIIAGCSEKGLYDENYNFVRFGLLVNANNEILVFPQVQQNAIENESYTATTTKSINIPVVMTTTLKDRPTDIFYSITTEGTFTDYRIAPIQKLTIPSGKLIDTLRIAFNTRWTSPNSNKIKLTITSTSNPELKIGWDRTAQRMDNITIILGDLQKVNYNFTQNLYNIQGTLNEELLIPINFSQPITNATVGNFDFINAQFVGSICDAASSAFSYSLERQPFIDGATQIFYKLKVLSTTPFATNLQLTLNTGLTDFNVLGVNQTNIVKSENIVREGDPAALWYNTADLLNRTYCLVWYRDPVTLNCRWGTLTQMFTKPVAVPKGSSFDNGLGYHKYRIGFVGNSAPIGTNPFDFQRFYGGTSNSSPAFNILQALEFFPENGTSTTRGIVKVVPQTLTFVKLSNSQNVNVPICGSGRYYFNPTTNRFEMYLDINCDETAINGNSNVVRSMYIYRNNVAAPLPAPLPINCSNRLTL